MIVVADASPLHYLVPIDHGWVLARMYGDLRVPREVMAELTAPSTPASVQAWAAAPPPWVHVERLPGPLLDLGLDLGETAAICLARGHRDALLLIDERDGRRVAVDRFRLNVVGTLGVLVDAASAGLIRLPRAFDLLRATNFRASKHLYEQLLAAHTPPDPD